MALLTWTDALALGQPQMDATHAEFVQHLADLEAAIEDGDAGAALGALIAHTEAHFGQEDRWMAALGFAPRNCHGVQHEGVLQVMREVHRRHTEAPDPALLQRLAVELARWFPQHAQTMDAALAQTMAEHGLDPATGAVARPPAPEAEPVSGCGSAACR
jgi:hemerythrin-like metal-binding protein